MNSTCDGEVDQIRPDGILGWAVDRADSGRRLAVELLLDGKSASVALVNIERTAPKAAASDRSTIGFHLRPPRAMAVDCSRMTVRIIGNGAILPFADSATAFEGVLECVRRDLIGGWAYRIGFPEARVEVLLKSGPKVLAKVVADQFRQDLLDSGRGDGRHGFLFDPAGFPPGVDLTTVVAAFSTTGSLLHDIARPQPIQGAPTAQAVAPASPVSVPLSAGRSPLAAERQEAARAPVLKDPDLSRRRRALRAASRAALAANTPPGPVAPSEVDRSASAVSDDIIAALRDSLSLSDEGEVI